MLIEGLVSSIRTVTVGFGLEPISTACAGRGLPAFSRIPPVRTFTFPETDDFNIAAVLGMVNSFSLLVHF